MVETHDLVKVFDDPERGPVLAVDHLCFTAAAGRVLGLLGPNGAGKTTTMRLLSTVLRPTSGTATVGGFDLLTEPAAVRQNIGFLSGTTGLYGRLTPTEMMRYFGSLYRLPPESVAVRTAEIFTRFAMHEFAHTPCERLSTGMKQKVSIARAILHDPPVLILDEPTAGLDVLVARAMHEFVRESAERGRCVLFSTHIMQQAEDLCDDLAIIYRGRILARGTLAELQQATGLNRLEDIFTLVVEANAALAEEKEIRQLGN
jgi:sodium transport system ATP-binding protein